MATFGGISNSAAISNFIEFVVGEQEFTAMVISYSSLLAPFSRKLSEVTTAAKTQSYPRIGLILSAAKNKDNSYLFCDPADPTNLVTLQQNVLDIMTSSNSPFSEGITRVAAALTASLLIRQLPINSDIKNIDLGDRIETQAIEDLDRIVSLLGDTNAVSSFTSIRNVTGGVSIYVSLGIDKTTLPASYFNVDPVTNTIVFEELYPNQTVKVIDSLTIPSNKVSYCYYYHSAWEREVQTSSGFSLEVNPPIEGFFEVRNGWTGQNIISALSDAFNESALKFTSTKANIIAAPISGDLNLYSASIVKKELYPDIADPYFSKLISFRLLHRLSYINFDVRRVSSVVNRELLIVNFFTVDKLTLANKLFPSLTAIYKGNYLESTSYSPGDIVDYVGFPYICLSTSTGVTPGTNNIKWSTLYSDLSSKTIRDFSSNGIPGLLYGLTPSFTFLDEFGPKSLILDVEKGSLKAVGSDSTVNPTEDELELSNTFYFKLASGFTTTSGVLRARVSSTNIQSVANLTPFLDSDEAYSFNVSGTAEEIALSFLEALFFMSQSTEVLGVLVYPHAVQIVNFKKTNLEIKEVVDLLDVSQVPGLQIATGTPIVEQTEYRSFSRSVVVKAESLTTQDFSNSIGIDTNGDYQVAAIDASKASLSTRLQFVYDKLAFLEKEKTGDNAVLRFGR